jgi:hypothetical protein
MDNPEEDRLESIHFNNVLRTFQQYRIYSVRVLSFPGDPLLVPISSPTCCHFLTCQLSANSRRLRDYYALPLQHQALLDNLGWRKKIDLVDERIEANSRFLKTIVDYPAFFEGDSDQDEDGDECEHDDEDASGDSGNEHNGTTGIASVVEDEDEEDSGMEHSLEYVSFQPFAQPLFSPKGTPSIRRSARGSCTFPCP